MVIHSPFFIGPRLLPALRFGDCVVSLEKIGETPSGRDHYSSHFDFADGRTVTTRDLKSRVGGAPLQDMFGALLSFLVACAESRKHGGDNADLFCQLVGQWAETWSDELSLAQYELEQTGEFFLEE